MNIIRTVSAVLLAIPLIVFGGNYFVQWFALPSGDGSAGAQLLEAMRDGGLMAAIAFSHVVIGVLLIVPRSRFLGGLLQLPVSIGIVAFHLTMLPAGLVVAVVLLLLNVGAVADLPRLRSLVERTGGDMTRMIITRGIDAPIDSVFRIVADIHRFSQAIPHIVKVEILSEVQSGVGTRFRETRLMNGKEATTELEVTEYVENDRIRLVADSHGTVWDTVFVVKSENGQTELTMTMDAKAHKLLPKLLNPMIMGMIRKAVEKDMDAVKAFCEK